MTRSMTQIADLADAQLAGSFSTESDALLALEMIRDIARLLAPPATAEPSKAIPADGLRDLPEGYRDLDTLAHLSRVLVEARALYGILETPGKASTKEIMAWAKEVDLAKVYPSDDVAWCGLFVAVAVKRAGWDVVAGPLWARNWANWGRKVEDGQEALGDVLVFSRETGGHVGFYVGEDAGYFHVLGGNQSDSVSITRIARGRLIACRRPKWRTAQPIGVVKVKRAASGAVSKNEA